MKKGMFLLTVFFTVCLNVSAQSDLIYKNGVWQNETKLSAKQVKELMASNEGALTQYNNGRALLVTGQVIGYPGAFILGFDLGARLGGGEGNETMLAVGAVGTVAGIIMMFVGENKIKNSLTLYNSKSNDVSYNLHFGLTQTGVGLSLRFKFNE
ncbi:MAG: hypothetical protein LBU91_01375 [Bacteroidales bacterium]|jgi:outer membrane lipoprotein SlyB|nr:hypothetical protein [Bacteroidales bacterium]